MASDPLTADIDRAAEILHAHPVTVRELAASGAWRPVTNASPNNSQT